MENEVIEKFVNFGINVSMPIITEMIKLFLKKQYDSSKKIEELQTKNLNEIVKEMLESGYITHTELLKFKNFMQIAKKADDFYKNQKQKINSNKDQIEFDWFTRFYEYASNITNEEFQNIWASILSKEYLNPGKISYVLLHALFLMQKQQADTFAAISRFALKDEKSEEVHPLIFISSNVKAYELSKITVAGLKELERLGLIEFDFKNEYVFLKKKKLIFGNRKISIIGDPNNRDRIKAGNVIFTKEGQVLYSVVGEEYKSYRIDILDFIVDKFIRRNCSISINDKKAI